MERWTPLQGKERGRTLRVGVVARVVDCCLRGGLVGDDDRFDDACEDDGTDEVADEGRQMDDRHTGVRRNLEGSRIGSTVDVREP